MELVNVTKSDNPMAQTNLDTICPKCADKAYMVESVIEERTYGDRFMALITGRIFHHIHEDGTKKECREAVPNWLFTLGSIEDVDKVRTLVSGLMGKFGNTKILRFM